MKKIENINAPEISCYCSLKKTNNDLQNSDEFFVAEGIKVVNRLLQSNLHIMSIFCTPEYWLENCDLISRQVPEHSIFTADISLMSQIVGYKMHTGVMAIAEPPGDTILENFNNRIIALNGIVNSENVGAIVRNAAAFDVNSLLFDTATSSPFLRRAVRVSLGNIFYCRYRRSKNLVTDLLTLRNDLNYSIVAAEITDNSVSIDKFIFPEKCIIIFGSEGRGVSAEILEICDHVVSIPMNPKSDSINVAAASAIFMYKMNA